MTELLLGPEDLTDKWPNVHKSLPCYVSSPHVECVPEYQSPSGGTAEPTNTLVSGQPGISTYPTLKCLWAKSKACLSYLLV